MRTKLRIALGTMLVASAAVAQGTPVLAATTFVVNRTGDGSDMNLANDVCDTSTKAGLQCSLRAAIQEANDTPGTDTINFNITGTSKVIQPNSPLPPITERIVIDGYSQSGAAENTLEVGTNAVLKIVLDGVNLDFGVDGLVLETTLSIVKGLVIQRFEGGAAIHIVGNGVTGGPNVIVGCYLGTNAAGTTARGSGSGIRVDASLQSIGGSPPEARNVISGNGVGIIVFPDVENVVILNNYIGTNAAGTAALGNGFGIAIQAGKHTQVGGASPADRNVISANTNVAIQIAAQTAADANNVVEGNYIGTKADGTGNLGNHYGVVISGSHHNYIGFIGSGNLIVGSLAYGISFINGAADNRIEGNTIKSGGLDGVETETGRNTLTRNAILENGRNGVRVVNGRIDMVNNAIKSNGELGIDLVGGTENSAHVTMNDNDDADIGAGNLTNFPVLTSARRNAQTGVTEVVVTLDAKPSTEYRVDLFRAVVDPSGYGEGQTQIATHTTTTNGKGDKTFSFLVSGVAIGTPLTATATPTNAGTGTTSEFARNRTVTN